MAGAQSLSAELGSASVRLTAGLEERARAWLLQSRLRDGLLRGGKRPERIAYPRYDASAWEGSPHDLPSGRRAHVERRLSGSLEALRKARSTPLCAESRTPGVPPVCAPALAVHERSCSGPRCSEPCLAAALDALADAPSETSWLRAASCRALAEPLALGSGRVASLMRAAGSFPRVPLVSPCRVDGLTLGCVWHLAPAPCSSLLAAAVTGDGTRPDPPDEGQDDDDDVYAWQGAARSVGGGSSGGSRVSEPPMGLLSGTANQAAGEPPAQALATAPATGASASQQGTQASSGSLRRQRARPEALSAEALRWEARQAAALPRADWCLGISCREPAPWPAVLACAAGTSFKPTRLASHEAPAASGVLSETLQPSPPRPASRRPLHRALGGDPGAGGAASADDEQAVAAELVRVLPAPGQGREDRLRGVGVRGAAAELLTRRQGGETAEAALVVVGARAKWPADSVRAALGRLCGRLAAACASLGLRPGAETGGVVVGRAPHGEGAAGATDGSGPPSEWLSMAAGAQANEGGHPRVNTEAWALAAMCAVAAGDAAVARASADLPGARAAAGAWAGVRGALLAFLPGPAHASAVASLAEAESDSGAMPRDGVFPSALWASDGAAAREAARIARLSLVNAWLDAFRESVELVSSLAARLKRAT